ncbi:MAG: hypothetical protein CSB06_03480 [Bacteroidia bacterium]|nr:MAG: hypothetical protein CSB06_03480 [Bacteroidia bacterium]
MKKTNNGPIADPGRTNQIKNGTTMTGDFLSQNDARIDGKIIGNLIVEGRIIVGESGQIEGNITCDVCDIEGLVEGNLQIKETLTLKSKARYTGDIVSKRLIIEPGAVFNGSCRMSNEIKASPKKTEEK